MRRIPSPSVPLAWRQPSAARHHPSATPGTRNFIDQHIFGRLREAGVPAASMSSDVEFVRRVYLDLTGRIPGPGRIREFLSDESPRKRDDLIDELLNGPQYADKWTMWMGDWLQNSTTGIYSDPVSTRNQFYRWIRDSVGSNRSMREIVYLVLAGGRESATAQTGAFLAATEVNTGPKEDSWDNMLAKSAAQFLGLGHYDCLLCHNGRGHLDPISLWGSRTTRIEAQRMAALFTNTFSYPAVEEGAAAGLQFYPTPGYQMETFFGNRPIRFPAPEGTILLGAYRDGSRPQGDVNTWREFLTGRIVSDPMFARNLANRLWKQMFGIGLVEPVDALDPDRLDPAKPPPAPWPLQASHPELLEELAQTLRDSDYDLRAFIRVIAQSSAWQLSSEWSSLDEWRQEYETLFARRIPRRLDAEEIHDAIAAATGVNAAYAIDGLPDPVAWAIQLPDTSEPTRDRSAKEFLDSFYRGDRLTAGRSGAPSLVQALRLLNHPFVLQRMRVGSSKVLRRLAALEDSEEIVRKAFVQFLSREPNARELEQAVSALRSAASREQAVEDLAWALVNLADFQLSY